VLGFVLALVLVRNDDSRRHVEAAEAAQAAEAAA